jgi:hypothetical protein
MDTFKLSSSVNKQLPEFVRSDYPLFVTFLEKYYQWLELNNNPHYEIDALRDANDIDEADSFYIDKLRNDLLPYFPKNVVADKRLFLKLITSFYKSSGTQESVKFLFKALYNDDIEIYYPKEEILIASDGKWVLPLALRIDTNDNNIFNIEKCLLQGETSKATAIVEKVIRSIDRQLGVSYIEVYISNVERLFATGETLTATYIDSITGLPVTVSGRLIGSLSEIKVDPNNRGLFYRGYEPENNYDGDPLSIVGGLNPDSPNPIGAVAYVGQTTKGSITDIVVEKGGFGFRSILDYPKSSILDFRGGFESVSFGQEAKANISLIDDDIYRVMNLSSTLVSEISTGSNITLPGTANVSISENVVRGSGTYFTSNLSVGDAIYIGSNLAEVTIITSDTVLNVTSNFAATGNNITIMKAGGTIANIRSSTINSISSFATINVHPISFITLDGSGGGYRSKPIVETFSFYNEESDDDLILNNVNVVKGTSIIANNATSTGNLPSLIEAGDYVRIVYLSSLSGAQIGEEVRELSFVDTNTLYFSQSFANDVVARVFKINRRDLYKLGSIGTIKINTGGSNYSDGDILVFTGGSGYGANGYVNVNGSGAIVSVTINNHSSNAYVIGGEGYTRDSLPVITVQSASGTGANLTVSEITGDGESYALTTSRVGAVSSIRVISYGYDYVSAPNVSLRNADIVTYNITEGSLFVSNSSIYQGASNTNFTFKATVDSYNPTTGLLRVFDYLGSINLQARILYDSETELNAVSALASSFSPYGDGNAKATAKFENGLIRYPGIYLNTDGQVSSDKKLQDGEKYHNFSYVLKTKTDYADFKKPLGDLVHPIGTKTFVVRNVDHSEVLDTTNVSNFITITSLLDTFNIAVNSNTIVSTNVTANLLAQVNVGDTILLSNVHRTLQNTVNVTSGSNVLTGIANNVNFINDLQEGDVIYLSTGNTVQIQSVTNSNFAILNTTINVTSTTVTANLVYSEIAIANSINANTIITTTNFRSNGYNLSATVQKVR